MCISMVIWCLCVYYKCVSMCLCRYKCVCVKVCTRVCVYTHAYVSCVYVCECV